MTRKGLTQKQIAGFWVYPYLETTESRHHVTIVIVKGMATEERQAPIFGDDVSVELLDAQDNHLQIVARPQNGPLPEVGGPSISANAVFQFTTSALPLSVMRVTIKGDTETFDVERTTTATDEKKTWFERFCRRLRRIVKCIVKIFCPRCCVKAFDVPTNRSGRQLTGNRLHESFNMNADFDSRGKCRCRCCEYRQDVRGEFTFNGVAAVHQLPGGPLDTRRWREDGVPNHFGPGRHFFYGHRSDTGTVTDIYQNPDRATGCQYRGFDDPGMSDPNPAVVMVMDLEFRGKIIDVCRGKVVRTTTWRVNYSRP